MLVTAPILAYFDVAKETHLHMDASTRGSHESWKRVQAGYGFLIDTESVIELELAVAWAVKKCNIFLSG